MKKPKRKTRNPHARALKTAPKVLAPEKGKGSKYSRTDFKKGDE